MPGFDTPLQMKSPVVRPDVRALAAQLRMFPRINDLILILQENRQRLLDVYVSSPASEFNRGQVVAATKLLKFIETGETLE